jgi:hypothetical protein
MGDDFDFGEPSAGSNRPPPTTFDFDSMRPKDLGYKEPTYGEAFTGNRIYQSKVPPKYNCTSVPGARPQGAQDRHVMSEREVRERYRQNAGTD